MRGADPCCGATSTRSRPARGSRAEFASSREGLRLKDMQITVQVRQDVAPALHGRESAPPEVVELRQRLAELGVRLELVHPGEDDPLLAPYLTAEVPDDGELTARVLRILEESAVVEAAYVKPPDELP
jgi:hypothetical protein